MIWFNINSDPIDIDRKQFSYGSTPPCWGIAAVMGRDPEQSHTAQHKCAAQTTNKMLTLNSSGLTEPAMWHWSGRKFTQSKKHPIKTTQTISPALSLCKSVQCEKCRHLFNGSEKNVQLLLLNLHSHTVLPVLAFCVYIFRKSTAWSNLSTLTWHWSGGNCILPSALKRSSDF